MPRSFVLDALGLSMLLLSACGSDRSATNVTPGSGGSAAGTATGGSSGGGGPSSGGAGAGGSAGVGGSAGAEPVVLDGTWQMPEAVSAEDTDYVVLALGACGVGDSIVVWKRDGGTSDQLFAARYDSVAAGWSAPHPLFTGARLDETTMKLAVNAGCDAILAWVGANSSTGSISLMGAMYAGTSGWSEPVELSPSFPVTTRLGLTQLGLSAAGDGVIAFVSESRQVMRIDYTTATGFSMPVPVSADERDAAELLFGMLPDGRAALMYQQYGTTSAERMALSWLRAADGSWSAGPLLGIELPYQAIRATGTDFLVRSTALARMSLDGAVSPLPDPPDVPLGNFASGSGTGMSGNADSTFFVARSDSGSVGYGSLMAARHDASTGWEAPVSLGRDDLISDRYDILVDGQGRAMAYYATNDDDIVVNRYVPDAGWSGPLLLADTVFSSGGSHMAMDPNGNVVIAWAALGGNVFAISHGIVAVRYVVDE